MTQITIRQVDDDLANRIKDTAQSSGMSMNTLILKLLQRQFSTKQEPESPKNDLKKYRKGWIEDPICEEALSSFSEIDEDEWK